MKRTRQRLAPYTLAFLTVTISLLLSVLLRPLLTPTMFMLFFTAVAVSAWYGGMEAGLLATALSTVALDYFFIEPLFTFYVYRIDSIVHLCVFLLVVILMSWFNRQLRSIKQRLDTKEQQLQVSEAKFKRLVDSNIIGVIVANVNGEIVKANDAFLKLVGYTQEELLKRQVRWQNITSPEYLEVNEQSIAELRNTGVFQPLETEYIHKNGSCVSVLMGGALLQESEDSQEEIISFCLDLTERKQAKKEREKLLTCEQAARAEAEAANRMKDEFLATLSHELRTPLNAMLGWTQLLKRRKFDETTNTQALEIIDRNTQSLAQLIEDVLDVSQIIRGKLCLNTYPVNFAQVVSAAIDTVRLAAEAREIRIECRFSPLVGVVMGDANRLQQVVWNLLTNAIKFTPNGGRVTVQLEQINSNIQLQVSDTGRGIAPEFLPYVFERFRQGDNSITRSHKGLGLGLALVRHLVELHGGTVCAASPGIEQGATFIVNLPLKVTAVDTNQLSPLIGDEDCDRCLPTLNGLRVLVVDDEPDALQLLTTILGQYGAQVMAVASALEALVALQQFHPDVLVSDIGMPQEDGYMLIRKLRALSQEEGGRIPAIALTAYAKAEDRTQALMAGFQLHVPKPVNPTELVTVVANLTGCT
ncbi:ATP-binding protein [Dendronalium sp. ChiSLP03b]|uniref:hybrid sensor histidine kinase/response regulator n=1 Tax=Dendronalium sp. ChiSLP03b TaxID=3075381 RepID=UPI002AD41831|nr:ATP-binding protein [Dendronalium sp. ChiSLP03b]MDZ8203050.1 ATP-binding protein [Dendronalium sp. ChiSLP03b]